MSLALRRPVPIRISGDWNDPVPGHVEVDFVAHFGTSSSGSFVQKLVPTDLPRAGPSACRSEIATATS